MTLPLVLAVSVHYKSGAKPRRSPCAKLSLPPFSLGLGRNAASNFAGREGEPVRPSAARPIAPWWLPLSL